MRKHLFPLMILAMLGTMFAAGCRTQPSPFAQTYPARIQFARSGGIAGEQRSMTLGSDGAYVLDSAGDSVISGRLSEADRQRAGLLVATVDWGTIQRNYLAPAAADTFTYAITLTAAGSGAVVATAVDETSLGEAPADLAALVRHLDQLMNRLTPAD